MYDIVSAIKAINSSAEVSLIDNSVDNITWLNGTTPINKTTILAKQTELKTAWDALDYSRKRKIEYDNLNQFELMYNDKINNTETWKTSILAIKAKYPKPS